MIKFKHKTQLWLKISSCNARKQRAGNNENIESRMG